MDVQKAYDTAVSERTRLAEEVSDLKGKNGELAQQVEELELAKVAAVTSQSARMVWLATSPSY